MDRDERLAEILGEWYAARDAGADVDAEKLTRAHPDFAEDIRAQLRIAEALGAVASPVRSGVPETLGPYRLTRELGTGGMGAVYEAQLTGDVASVRGRSRVAVKLIHPHLMRTPGFFKRFLREAEIGRRVVHENVVRTLDFDAIETDAGSFHFLVMEYVEGQTLRGLIDELDRVPEELCRHIGCEVARGLAAIHAAGAIHRDVKPENVLITADHQVKLMDLGVARMSEETIRLSHTGAFVGSLHYAAPEQFGTEGASIDHRIDLHALGLLLYELATGRPVFQADGMADVVRQILHTAPRRLGEVNPQLSPFFEELVHALLEKDPDRRPKQASDVEHILAEGERSTWWDARARRVRHDTRRPLRRIRIPRETNVYGREQELAALRVCFGSARGGDGAVVLVQGEAGIGKSRLIDELVAQVQADGEDVNFLFGSYPPGGAASAAGAFSSAFREHFGDEGLEQTLGEHMSATPALVPAFAAVLRGDAPPPDAHPLDSKSLVSAFLVATRALAAERPTIILIDDLHFAPDDGRALFSALATALAGDRVLLIGTARPGVPQEWLSGVTRLDHATQLSLSRLGPKDLVNLLRDAFRSERLAIDLGAQIGVKSDGNPFFVFEILRGLKEGQFITQSADGSWVSTRMIDQIHVPSSVLDLVNARVADLSEEDRDLLDVAACCGFEFDPVLVGAALGLGRIPVLKRLGQIERRHRLVRSAGVRYVFDHHQVQEALYQSIGELLRREYHRALADAMEAALGGPALDVTRIDGSQCVLICEHLLNAVENERALRYMEPTLKHLEDSSLEGQVIDVARRFLAVEGLVEGAERVKLLLRCAHPLSHLGRMKEMEDVQERALELARSLRDPYVLGLALADFGWSLFHHSRYEEAEAMLRQAAQAGRDVGDKDLEMRATGDLGTLLGRVGRPGEALPCYVRAKELATDLGDMRQLAAILTHLGICLRNAGRPDEAIEHFEESLSMGRRLDHTGAIAYATLNIGQTLRAKGELDRARAHTEQTIAFTRAHGMRLVEEAALYDLAATLGEMGEYAAAAECVEQSSVLCKEFGNEEMAALGGCAVAYLRWATGEFATAWRVQQEAWPRLESFGSRRPAMLGTAALLQATLGDVDGALALLDDRMRGGVEAKRPQEVADLRWAQSMVWSMNGDHDRAARTAASGVDAARAGKSVNDLGRLLGLQGAALAEAGRIEEARPALLEALQVAEVVGLGPLVCVARCRAAGYLGHDVPASIAAFEASAERVTHVERIHLALLFWRRTTDAPWLVEAQRLLDLGVGRAPAEFRRKMVENVSLFRDVVAAAAEHLDGARDGA